MQKSISISKSFFVFLICFSIFIFLISLGLSLKHYYTVRNTINQKLQNQSERIADSFLDVAEYTKSSMSNIAVQIVINGKKNDYDFIKRLLISYRVPNNKIMELSNFVWVNEKHRYIISSNQGFHFDEYLDLSKRDYIPKTITEPFTIHLGKPVYGIFSKKYSIPAGYGVFDKKNNYLGTIVTGFVIDAMQKKFDEIINSEGIGFALIDKDGSLITKSANVNFKEIQNFLSGELDKAKQGGKGVLHISTLFENNKDCGSIYYNNLKDYPYVVLTIYDKNLEKAEINNMLLTHIMVFLALLIILVILLFYFYKNMIGPIIKLSDITQKILDDDQNTNFKEPRNIEINHLYKAIISIREFIQNEKNLKNQLYKTSTKLKSLVGTIAHELRNPLNAINLAQNQVRELLSEASPENINQAIKQQLTDLNSSISSSVTEANNTINIILSDLSNKPIESGDFSYLSTDKILPEVIKTFGYRSLEEKEKVKLNSKDNFIFKAIDDRFTFIIYNLLKNALYYLSQYPDSIVTVGAETRSVDNKEYNSIYVHDTGPGIPTHIIPKLFGDFFTLGKK